MTYPPEGTMDDAQPVESTPMHWRIRDVAPLGGTFEASPEPLGRALPPRGLPPFPGTFNPPPVSPAPPTPPPMRRGATTRPLWQELDELLVLAATQSANDSGEVQRAQGRSHVRRHHHFIATLAAVALIVVVGSIVTFAVLGGAHLGIPAR